MKQSDTIEKDAAFLRANIATNEERIKLPESLSEENIVDLVSGKKQKRNKKAIIKRFVGVAVAACVALGIFTALDYGVYAPKQLSVNDKTGLAYAENYDDIVAIVKDYAKYKKAEDARYGLRSFNGVGKSADVAVEEIAEDSAISYGAMAESNTMAAAGAADDEYRYVDAEVPAENGSAIETASTTAKGAYFAETNTREDGVGEADNYITDGEYLYVQTFNNFIAIFKAENDGTLTLTGEVDCAYDNGDCENPNQRSTNVTEFYVSGDRLIATVTYWTYNDDWTQDKTLCGVMVYDIADRANPVLLRSYFQDGYYTSSRTVGDSLILISNYYINDYVTTYTAENVIPGTYDRADGEKCLVSAGDIAVVNTAKPDSYVVVGKVDLSDLSKTPETTVLFGGGCEVYCTTDTLYVYNTEYNWSTAFTDMVWRSASSSDVETKTTVLSFDITGSKPAYKAQGTVEGYLLNSWSLDAYNGYLRLAVTRNDENAVVVLDGDLQPVGELTGIAPGEIIKSVRFMGDTAYVVTFVQTDPLFVIDLSDPAKPVVKGEVKLPGFSSYLHPVGDGLLLGIGSGGTEDGIDGSAKISLFDVSDPTAPKELDSIVIQDSYLNTDYKAFVTVKADGSFLIPLDIYTPYTMDDGANAYTEFKNY
ncbi:MAG: beta-propeller domain-containing protein, partial [Clostridia bacterium]|nr:beta-propeller domain-containing protein [Clostridia bacterium]